MKGYTLEDKGLTSLQNNESICTVKRFQRLRRVQLDFDMLFVM